MSRKNKTSEKPTKFLDPISQVLTLFLESPSQFASSSVRCSHTPEIHFLEFCKPISVREKLKKAKKAKLKKAPSTCYCSTAIAAMKPQSTTQLVFILSLMTNIFFNTKKGN